MPGTRPTQIFRHTAIVISGAASLTLTVVSGAYIVSQMPGTDRGDQIIAGPSAPSAPIEGAGPQGPLRARDVSDALLSRPAPAGIRTVLPAVFPNSQVLPHTVPGASSPTATAAPAVSTTPGSAAGHMTGAEPDGLGSRIGLGPAYIDAQVRPVDTDTVTVTLDINTPISLSDLLSADRNRSPLPDGATRLHTEVDTGRAAMTVRFSDPALGDHAFELGEASDQDQSSEAQGQTAEAAVPDADVRAGYGPSGRPAVTDPQSAAGPEMTPGSPVGDAGALPAPETGESLTA